MSAAGVWEKGLSSSSAGSGASKRPLRTRNEEEIMTQDRRSFLKTTALAGAAAAAAGVPAAAVAQRAAAPTTGSQQLPRGLVLANLRRADGFGLGVRTERGILDVAAAEQELHENAPTTIDAFLKGQGDVEGLKRLVDKSQSAGRHIVPIEQASFGPCVTNP